MGSGGSSLFRVRVHRRATRTLDDLPTATSEHVLDLLLVLEDDPVPIERFDVKRIHGTSGWFRVRVGNYRVIYWVDEESRVVTVERITPRGDAYGD
jgi:mRNA interferase RelE/StbE